MTHMLAVVDGLLYDTHHEVPPGEKRVTISVEPHLDPSVVAREAGIPHRVVFGMVMGGSDVALYSVHQDEHGRRGTLVESWTRFLGPGER